MRLFLPFFYLFTFLHCNAIFTQNLVSDSINSSLNKKNTINKKVFSQSYNGWSVNLQYGIIKFHGDLSEYVLYPAYEQSIDFHELRSAISLSFKKRLNSIFSLEGKYIFGEMAGMRKEYNTNDTEYFDNHYDPYYLYQGNGEKFINEFIEFDFITKTNLSSFSSYLLDYRFPKKIRLELDFGVGFNQYRVLRTNLYSNDFIFSYGYREWDGISGGQTETESSPSAVLIYGLSSSYSYSSRLDINFSYNVHRSFTDKWDGSPSISERDNDMYSFVSLGFSYKLGEHNFETEWTTPIDELKDDMTYILANIDGLSIDSDNDGIADAFDKSKDTPYGVSVDGSGTPFDVDMDNIPDYLDADPFSLRGASVNENGVEFDDDNDGVPNSIDLEPNTPQGVIVNKFGISSDKFTPYVNFSSLYFSSGSYAINTASREKLAEVALFLKKNSDVRLKVIGYSDSEGDLKYNQKLSLERAKSVVSYLQKNYLISIDRFSIDTKIQSQDVFNDLKNEIKNPQSFESLMKLNRRVDFEIVSF